MSYDDVRQILPNEYGVCGMSGSHLRFTTRGGVVQLGWKYVYFPVAAHLFDPL
jgi:hypothetical protein